MKKHLFAIVQIAKTTHNKTTNKWRYRRLEVCALFNRRYALAILLSNKQRQATDTAINN